MPYSTEDHGYSVTRIGFPGSNSRIVNGALGDYKWIAYPCIDNPWDTKNYERYQLFSLDQSYQVRVQPTDEGTFCDAA